jgi:uncharacterized membrane protein
MATQTKQGQGNGLVDGLLSELPVDRLKDEVVELGKALAKRGVAKIGASLTGTGGKLGDLGDAVPGPGDMVKAGAKAAAKAASPVGAVKGAAGKVKDAIPGVGSGDDDSDEDAGDSGGKGKVASMDSTDLKVTNIVETIDVPVSREIAYDLWTQFEAFPAFMKKVEAVNQKDPEEVTWKAQIFWSHRTWKAKIIDQVPPEHIVWKSEGEKGHVDGAVTFHELAPDLTRVLVSLEYFPQGLFERTGNLWRAQGRRVRLELKHYRRFVANHALLQQDEVDGWEGEIHDGKVKRQRSSSTAKKSSSSGSTAKKSASSGSTAKKSAARKSTSSSSTAKKSASGSSTAKKTASGGSTAKKTAARKTTARKTASSGSTARKSTAKKTASSGSTAKKTAAKKTTARKTASSGSTAKKTAARKSTSQRTAAAAKRTPTTTSRTSSGSGSSGRSRSTGSSGRKTGRSASASRSKR